ncbi:MAG TPA: 30S ribosomal protein S8 [Ignavibacteriaceae bacterium]|jgi:small subunit ribosomal protein S8|nr:MAG: 30S ribosomal protein S8 [Ignavibacteria bacterium ADurb.Bin266]OQY69821.1 MAG: 30S ribosomal protein S8 [Ignavibacteriales bacterium UTCHB2]HQF43395.1 30S ribosomal protein S8 [Ignavibacteriaceae bacterium]HQI40411.1 30S ribosomal protein S8 [Ignavibacteriaceae bacterium]HQJ45908.1 30S ribosomal protein S8 [Ignavibacteriaceae bacterium]
MPVTDPISDFLVRIGNAAKAKKLRVEIPASKMKVGLAEILKKENYIHDFSLMEDNKQNVIKIHLKYRDGASAITGLKRISKPGLRIYKDSEKLPRVLNGLGTAVISTSKGLMTDKEARNQSIGGEVICYIW